MRANRCDRCGKFRRGPYARQPFAQSDYLLGRDPQFWCPACVADSSTRPQAGEP